MPKKTKSFDDSSSAAILIPLNLGLGNAKDLINQQSKTIKGGIINLQQITQLIDNYQVQSPAKRDNWISTSTIYKPTEHWHPTDQIHITKLIDKLTKELQPLSA